MAKFLCQRVEFVRNEFLDIVLPRHDVSGFRVPILRTSVSTVEVVAQPPVRIDARLDQLGPALVQPSSFGEQGPTESTSVSATNRRRGSAHGR